MKVKPLFIYFLFVVLTITSIIACVDNDDYSTPSLPPKGFFKETFDNVKQADGSDVGNTNATRPKIENAINYDNSPSVKYLDPQGKSDIRFVSSINNGALFVWIPYNNGTPASLILDNLPTKGRKNVTLKYKFNDSSVYNSGSTSNANVIILKCNDVKITVPDIPINTNKGANKFISVRVLIPNGTTKIEFSNPTKNGLRIDDIELIEN